MDAYTLVLRVRGAAKVVGPTEPMEIMEAYAGELLDDPDYSESWLLGVMNQLPEHKITLVADGFRFGSDKYTGTKYTGVDVFRSYSQLGSKLRRDSPDMKWKTLGLFVWIATTWERQ